jgi:predicted transcriptional regulator
MGERPFELGEAELEVLKVLWDHGPASVRTVMEILHQRGRRVAYTTVQTFLTRLEQKGHVASDKSGFAYVFKARLTRERVTRSRLHNLVRQLYDGAAGQLVLQLVKTERFTPDELNELSQLVDSLDAKGNDAKGKGRKPKLS